MGLISGSGGGTFNGGTITSALTVHPPSGPGQTPLSAILSEAGLSMFALNCDVSGKEASWVVNDDATVLAVGRNDGSSDPWMRLRKAPSGVDAVALKADGTRRVSVKDDAGAERFGVTVGGYLLVKTNAAPADAVLAANELALWFDPTNGASKLMVKAKQADGTVKTATVALA